MSVWSGSSGQSCNAAGPVRQARTAVEGLAQNGRLDPLREALDELGAGEGGEVGVERNDQGGIQTERIQLNEDTIWAGGPYDPADD